MSRKFRLKPWQPKERQIQSAIIEALHWEAQIGRVIWSARVNGGMIEIPGEKRSVYRSISYWIKGQKHTKGFPDVVGQLADGRFFAFEVKTARGKVSEDQKRFLDNAATAGALACVVRSADEAVIAIRNHFRQPERAKEARSGAD